MPCLLCNVYSPESFGMFNKMYKIECANYAVEETKNYIKLPLGGSA